MNKFAFLAIAVLVTSTYARIPDRIGCANLIKARESHVTQEQGSQRHLMELYKENKQNLVQDKYMNDPNYRAGAQYIAGIYNQSMNNLRPSHRKRVWKYAKDIFYEKCGGFNKRDQNTIRLYFIELEKTHKIAGKIMKDPLLHKHWEKLQPRWAPTFTGYRDFQAEKIGYN